MFSYVLEDTHILMKIYFSIKLYFQFYFNDFISANSCMHQIASLRTVLPPARLHTTGPVTAVLLGPLVPISLMHTGMHALLRCPFLMQLALFLARFMYFRVKYIYRIPYKRMMRGGTGTGTPSVCYCCHHHTLAVACVGRSKYQHFKAWDTKICF